MLSAGGSIVRWGRRKGRKRGKEKVTHRTYNWEKQILILKIYIYNNSFRKTLLNQSDMVFKMRAMLRIDLVRSENICGRLQSPFPCLVRPLHLCEHMCVSVVPGRLISNPNEGLRYGETVEKSHFLHL